MNKKKLQIAKDFARFLHTQYYIFINKIRGFSTIYYKKNISVKSRFSDVFPLNMR